MANQMTSLDTRFFWHQFKAGPWLRLLLIPIGLMFIVGGAWVGTWIPVIFGAFVGTSTLITTFYPEQGAFRAYGMNSARARQQLLLVTAPVVLVAIMANVVFVPLPAIAATGAMTSVAMGALLVLTHDAVGDHLHVGGQQGSAIKPSVNLPFQAVWRKSLIWSTVAGVLLAAAIAATGFIGNETLSSFVASLPLLVFFAWFGSEAVEGGISPLVAKSYGLTRKQWAAHVAGVSAVSGILAGAVAGAVSSLLPLINLGSLHNPGIAWHPFIVTAAAVAAFCLFASGIVWTKATFTLMTGFLLWFGLRDVLRFEEATIAGPLSLGVLVISAIVAIVGGVHIALYVTGRTNIKGANIERITGSNHGR